MRKEDGLVADVEREGDSRHDVHRWIVIAERFRRQGERIFFRGVVVGLEPRRRVGGVHGQHVGICDFRAQRVVPSVSISESDNGAWPLQRVHVHGKVFANVFRDECVAAEGFNQAFAVGALNVTHGVGLADDIRVFQNRLVGVEAVDTQAHVEDDVVERELVHDVSRDVNRLVGTNGARVVVQAIHLVC